MVPFVSQHGLISRPFLALFPPRISTENTVPTTYADQFYLIDPYSPPPVGTALNFAVYNLQDRDDDGDIGTAGGDRINGRDVRGTYNGDTVTVQLSGGSVVTITGVTFYLSDGSRVFTPSDGSVLQNATFVSSSWVSSDTFMNVSDLGPACFVVGTRIATPDGPRRIETLAVGEPVLTRDAGPQPILWIGRRTSAGDGDHAPIRICKGALGNSADLLVSPQHRMLIDGWRAELFFGQDEVLVAAKHLVAGNDAIHVQKMREVDYMHLLLDGHQVIRAEGAACESFDPGGDLALYDPQVRHEIDTLCPGLIDSMAPRPPTVHRVVGAAEAQVLGY